GDQLALAVSRCVGGEGDGSETGMDVADWAHDGHRGSGHLDRKQRDAMDATPVRPSLALGSHGLRSGPGQLPGLEPCAHSLTGNWGGWRSELEDDYGLYLFGNYTSEIAGNPVGGITQGITYTHNVGLAFLVDLDKLAGIPHTTFIASASN